MYALYTTVTTYIYVPYICMQCLATYVRAYSLDMTSTYMSDSAAAFQDKGIVYGRTDGRTII